MSENEGESMTQGTAELSTGAQDENPMEAYARRRRQERLDNYNKARSAIRELLRKAAAEPDTAPVSILQPVSEETGLDPADVQWTLATLIAEREVLMNADFTYSLNDQAPEQA